MIQDDDFVERQIAHCLGSVAGCGWRMARSFRSFPFIGKGGGRIG